MQRAAATSSTSAGHLHSGEHLLQGGHAILKDDPEPMARDATDNKARDISEGASQRLQQPYGYGGTRAADLEQAGVGGGGMGEGVRKRDTQSH
ncbi:hypothetical protein TgHK011_009393 [Trichoderma gracile]|nr:hypothetical protein TgHK011_009393 [Trichoderma gracile]